MGADGLTRALALALLLAAAGCAEDAAAPEVETGRVDRVTDGDTLRLADGRRIRLVQIDSPEPGSECFGTQATRHPPTLAPPGTQLELERDPRLDDTDRFGRFLRYARAGGRSLNVVLVERGAAAPYFFRGSRGRYADELEEAAAAARAAPRGLWAACPRARLDPERALETGPR